MRPATATRQDHMTTTSQRFNRALLSLAARGERPRCADPITHVMWNSMINTAEPSQPCGVPAVRWPTRLNQGPSGIGLTPIH
jgi:hypothetical protein